MGDKVYFTMLKKDEAIAKEIFLKLRNYGLNPVGHYFKDDLTNMAWASSRGDLLDKEIKAWIIYGEKEQWETDAIRIGLSLLFLCKRPDLNVLILVPEGADIKEESVPFLFRKTNIIEIKEGFEAKLMAKMYLPYTGPKFPFRICPHAVPGLGIWLEVGPAYGEWNGVLIGVRKSGIRHLGIGEKGNLPDKTVLEYPVRNMKIEVDGKEFVAWAVRNKLNKEISAYANLEKSPYEVILGPWNDEKPEIYNLELV